MFLIFSFALKAESQQETVVLTHETIGRYNIVVYNESSSIQKFAAQELQHYLEVIFKIKLPEVKKGQISFDQNYFFLGQGFLKDSLQQNDSMSKGAFIKAFHDGNIYLGGKDDLDVISVKNSFFQKAEKANFGTLYAVYDFLENNLGIHWFFPTYLGESIPKDSNFKFKNDIVIVKPNFEERSFFWKTLYYDKDTTMYWMLRNKLTITSDTLFKHNWYNLLPSANYFDSMPELFAELDGKRIKQVSKNKAHGNSAQLCTTNKSTIDLTIKNIIHQIESNHANQISLSPNDGRGFCECDQCKLIDSNFSDYSEYSNLSHRIFSFYKTVSDSIFKRFPNVNLGGYAYKRYAMAYDDLNLSERFHIRLAINNYGFGNLTCSSYHELSVIISSWKNRHQNVGFNSYPYGGYWIYPALRTVLFTNLIKELKACNFKKIRFIFFPDWYNQGLDIWIISKLFWNPDLNVDLLKEQYYNAVYPNTKKTIKNFHKYLENRFNNIDYCLENMTMTVRDTRNLFLSIFQKDSLLIYKEQITESLKKNEPDNIEEINLQNFLKVIDLLIMEYNAYTQYKIFHIVPNKEEKQKFSLYVEGLRKTLCITNKSAYFNPKKSPSYYLKRFNWFYEN